MKNGMERRLKFKHDSGQLVNALFRAKADGGTEMVQVSKVKRVTFLKVPRIDIENTQCWMIGGSRRIRAKSFHLWNEAA